MHIRSTIVIEPDGRTVSISARLTMTWAEKKQRGPHPWGAPVEPSLRITGDEAEALMEWGVPLPIRVQYVAAARLAALHGYVLGTGWSPERTDSLSWCWALCQPQSYADDFEIEGWRLDGLAHGLEGASPL